MRNKNSEIEIKVKVQKLKPLLDFLNKKARFQKENVQIDEYFTPKHRNFIKERPVKEWFRLRHAYSNSLNYKKWHYDKHGKTYEADEFETEIRNLSQARKILAALNFKSLVKVDKVRKVWIYKNYEIAVDSVKKLGEFVEIEFTGKRGKKSAKQITAEMVNFLRNLNCGRIDRNFQGYPFLLLFKNEAKYEMVSD